MTGARPALALDLSREDVSGFVAEMEQRHGMQRAWLQDLLGGAADQPRIVELMNRVDRQESIVRLEAVLKNDPTLAFRLVRYINSAAFGLRVEISSFRHAIMMLGYQKLKRWLALLLASASTDPNVKPVMFAALRRGLFME